jgi:hypothetical protein
MVKVYLDSVRASEPDSDGCRLITIGEQSALAFEGTPQEAAIYLAQSVRVGTSVAVRHAGGIRSCMNKPSLWSDVYNKYA